MNTRYIRKSKSSYAIVKSNKSYANVMSLDDALFLRNLLVENDWDLDSIGQIYELDGSFIVLGIIDEKICILDKAETQPSQKEIDELTKRRARNPNNSRYGLNITRVFDTFVIRKRIAGDDHVFGYYDNLEDAEFVRNWLLDNMWNVNGFSQIQYDEDNGNYKVIEVIDEKAYVLGSFSEKEDIDLDGCRRDFLSRISKHKLGLASYNHLSELTDMIPDLEKRFATKAQDDIWEFKDTQDPLNDIIFTLTPFQKCVYDAVDNSTVEDVEKSLARFKSKNFTLKIQKNLDELEDMGLIRKDQNRYSR